MTKTARLLTATVALLTAVHVATLRPGHEWGDDFSLYLAHARNIAEGRPYADTGYIYNPANAVLSPRTYPPVFPLLLAPVYRLFGLDLTAMKVFECLLFMALLVVLTVLVRKRLPLPHAVGCLVLFALNPYVWQHKDRLLSETPFMLFAYLALLLSEKAQESGATAERMAWGLLAGLMAYLACGTRTIGVVLIPSILGWGLLRYRRLGLVPLTITATFVVGVVVEKTLLSVDGSYLDQLVYDPGRFVRIGVSLVKAMGTFLQNGYSHAAQLALFGSLLVLVVLGLLTRLRNGLTVYEWFSGGTLLLLLLWPAAEYEARFLMPLLPLFFLYAGEGMCRLQSTALARLEKPLAAGLAVAVLASYAGWYSQMDAGPVRDGVATPDAVALFDWIKQQTAPEDVFLFQKPRALALFTRRHAVAHDRKPTDESLRHTLQMAGVTHVVVGGSSPSQALQTSRRALEAFIARHPESFDEVYANSGFTVYSVRDLALASR